jgi:hypothetical protein
MAVAFGAMAAAAGSCAPTAIPGGGGCGGCRGLCSATDKALSARSCSSEAIRSKPWAITAAAAAFAKTRSWASGMPAKMIDLTGRCHKGLPQDVHRCGKILQVVAGGGRCSRTRRQKGRCTILVVVAGGGRCSRTRGRSRSNRLTRAAVRLLVGGRAVVSGRTSRTSSRSRASARFWAATAGTQAGTTTRRQPPPRGTSRNLVGNRAGTSFRWGRSSRESRRPGSTCRLRPNRCGPAAAEAWSFRRCRAAGRRPILKETRGSQAVKKQIKYSPKAFKLQKVPRSPGESRTIVWIFYTARPAR